MLAFTMFLAFQLWHGQALPVAVAYPPGVPEFERAAAPRLASGAWVRFTGVGNLAPGQVIYTFGRRAAKSLELPGFLVVEHFVAGERPLHPRHGRVAWEAPVEAWEALLGQFSRVAAGRPFCVVETPMLARRSPAPLPSGARRLVMDSRERALSLAADLLKGRQSCGGVVLAADFEVLDSLVLEAFARVQARAGIPLFARTRHEVLMGAVAAVEPQAVDWDADGGGTITGQIFYNKAVAAWLGVAELVVPSRWRSQALAR